MHIHCPIRAMNSAVLMFIKRYMSVETAHIHFREVVIRWIFSVNHHDDTIHCPTRVTNNFFVFVCVCSITV